MTYPITTTLHSMINSNYDLKKPLSNVQSIAMNTLQYGFENSLMYLDVPGDVFEKAMNEGEHFEKIVNFKANQRVVDAEPNGESIRLLLNTKRAGNKSEDYIKEDRARHMVYAVSTVAGFALPEQQDPQLEVQMGYRRLADGDRLGMSADVLWPNKPDSIIQLAATRAMRGRANDLQYFRPLSFIPELVYAVVSRQDGITLETNPMGACDMGTDGMFYDPTEDRVELHHHNLYSHSMQLICLSGLIAIARA